MKQIKITGEVSITDISLGLGALGAHERAEECFSVIDRYLEYGGNCIDTARMYRGGETDEVLGRWLKRSGKRDKVVLCTKGCFPADPQATHISRLSPEEIRGDLEDNLRALGVDWVDLYLLHRDDVHKPVEEIMPVLDKLVKEGKVRAVGASNWTGGRIAQANAFAKENGLTPFSVSQVLYSLARTTPAQTGDLTHIAMNDVEHEWYRETGFPVIAYSSQAKGYFSRFAAGLEQRPSVSGYFDFLPDNARRARRVMELGQELGMSPAAVALAYIRASELRVSALLAFSRPEQLEDSMQALDHELTREQAVWLERG